MKGISPAGLGQPYLKADPIPSSTWAIQIELGWKKKKGRRRKTNREKRRKKKKKMTTTGSYAGVVVLVERMDLGRVGGWVNTF